jgi:TRAP-type C4-dicarboxylate transport system permease small subunit
VSLRHRAAACLLGLDRALDALVRSARWLALPLALLLFLQWPLREWVQAYSREANDLAQVLFAFYVAVAVTAATRARTHLAVDALAARRSAAARARLERAVAALVLLPAAAGLAVLAAAPVARSVQALELFPESYKPGYFAIKVALALSTLGILAQAVVRLFDSGASHP